MIIFLETSEKKQVFSAAKYTVGRRDEVQSFFAHRYSQRCARDPAIRGTCKTFQIKKRGDTTQSTRENTKKNNCFFFQRVFFLVGIDSISSMGPKNERSVAANQLSYGRRRGSRTSRKSTAPHLYYGCSTTRTAPEERRKKRT